MNDVVKYETTFGDVEISPATVKKYLVRGNGNITEQEVMFFLKLCEAQKLNPFVNGEVYLIKYGNEAAQTVIGYNKYLRRAEENPEYMYKESGIIVRRGTEIVKKEGACLYTGEELLGGWCKVHRRKFEVEVTSYKECAFAEYNKGKALWKEKPAMMIEKVATSQALRDAFPTEFSGLYTVEELAPGQFREEDLGEVKVGEIVEEDRAIEQDERVKLFEVATQACGSKDEGVNLVKQMLADRGITTTKDLKLSVYKEVMQELYERKIAKGLAEELTVPEGTDEKSEVV